MPRKQTIRISLYKDDNGELAKMITAPCHAGRGGTFTWVITNDLGLPPNVKVKVDLRDFDPLGYVDIKDDLPVEFKKQARVSGTVINALPIGKKIVTYTVWLDDGSGMVQLDPDLNIDGDGDGAPHPKIGRAHV